MPLSFAFFKHRPAPWLALLLAVCGSALADAPVAAPWGAAQVQNASLLAGACANCHGPDGHARSSSDLASLRSRSAHELQQLLLAFKAGTIANTTVMTRLMKGYDAAQIEALAQWYGTKEAQ